MKSDLYIDMEKNNNDLDESCKFLKNNFLDINLNLELYEKIKKDKLKYPNIKLFLLIFLHKLEAIVTLSNKHLIFDFEICHEEIYFYLKEVFLKNEFKNKRKRIFFPEYKEDIEFGDLIDNIGEFYIFKTLWHINVLNQQDLENIHLEKLNQDYLRKITKNKNIHLEKLSDETYLLSSLDNKGNIYFLEDKDIFILRKELLKEEKLPHEIGLRV